jgi:hypothetical protein
MSNRPTYCKERGHGASSDFSTAASSDRVFFVKMLDVRYDVLYKVSRSRIGSISWEMRGAEESYKSMG